MQTTSNHGLKKPEYTDSADIADLNYNFDKIDNMPVLYRQSSEPSNKISGKTLWYDTSAGSLKLWNGSAWEAVGGGSCDFMLSKTDLETNLANSSWLEEFFGSPLRLCAVAGGPMRSYWWPYIADTESAMEFIAADTAILSSVLADKVARDEIWQSAKSQEIWLIGTPTPPHTYTSLYGGVYLAIVDGRTSGGKAVRIYQPNAAKSGTYDYSFDLDLTGISTLKLYTKRAVSSGYSNFYTEIKIDGTTVYSENGSDSGYNFYQRSFDVSSVSGTVTIVFQMRITTTLGSSSYNWSTIFSDLVLEV